MQENKQKTIVLVLRSGGDFSMSDVLLIAKHIHLKWVSEIKPKIICLYDKVDDVINLGNIELHPLGNNNPRVWCKIALFSPEMEKYRPFLFIDLDTAIIASVEKIFDLVENKNQFITLEDFWQPGELSSGVLWIPANSNKIKKIWDSFTPDLIKGFRMDMYIRKCVKADNYWQKLTSGVYDFKKNVKFNKFLVTLPENSELVCFHGKPRIPEAQNIPWVKDYVNI